MNTSKSLATADGCREIGASINHRVLETGLRRSFVDYTKGSTSVSLMEVASIGAPVCIPPVLRGDIILLIRPRRLRIPQNVTTSLPTIGCIRWEFVTATRAGVVPRPEGRYMMDPSSFVRVHQLPVKRIQLNARRRGSKEHELKVVATPLRIDSKPG